MLKLLFPVVVALGACLVEGRPPAARDGRPTRQPSLFVRLGGIPGITSIVDGTLGQAQQDLRLRSRFANTNMFRLRNGLVDRICALSAGPCHDQVPEAKAAHRGMGISSDEFDALVENLKLVLARYRMPVRDQNDLIAILATAKRDIVEPVVALAPAHPTAALPPAPTGPVTLLAQSLRESASLLDRAEGERRKGNRSLAEQLFSFAEMMVGADALAPVSSLFREGAPPRVTTPTVPVSVKEPPQPQALGNSDDDEPVSQPARGSLVGDVQMGGASFDGFAIVTLEPASGKPRRRQPRHRTIEQRGRQFAPHVLVVPVGSTVAFPNFDSIYHNVFSRSAVKPFDLGLYKAGEAREVRFDNPGVVRIGCNLHENMSAVVAVVGEPYYAVTDARGHFAFRSIPPGNYRLRAYTEGSDEPTLQTLRILPERNRVVVPLPPTDKPGLLADKFGVPRVEKTSP